MKPGTFEVVMIAIDIALAGIVILAVGVLAVYHTYCLFKGQTTIEGWERTKTKRLISRRKIDSVNNLNFTHQENSNIRTCLG